MACSVPAGTSALALLPGSAMRAACTHVLVCVRVCKPGLAYFHFVGETSLSVRSNEQIHLKDSWSLLVDSSQTSLIVIVVRMAA